MDNHFLFYRHTSSEINEEIQLIIENSSPTRRFSKGEIIYLQGDIASNFCYLKKGRVKVYMTSVDGMEKTLNTASHGELLGEGAFFDKKPRVSSARAVTNVEVIMIDEKKLTQLITDCPKLAFELLKILSNRIRLLSTQLDSMTFMQADARIAGLLLESEHNGIVQLTHEEIANIVGVSRVTVSKVLGRFVKSGYIATEYRQIVLKDKAGMNKKYSDFV